LSGLTNSGFDQKTAEELRLETVDSLNSGPLGPIDDAPDGPFGQIIDTFNKQNIDIWEQLSNIWNALNPLTAEGVPLTNISTYVGMSRLNASPTTIRGIIEGVDTTVVPSGSLANTSFNNASYSLDSDTTIDKGAAVQCVISPNSAVAGTPYSILVNGDSFSYTAQVGDTKEDISFELANLINISSVALVVNATWEGDNLYINSEDYLTPFSFDVVLNTSIEETWVTADFTAVVAGNVSASPGTLDTIETPVTGWRAVDNKEQGQAGRDLETDIELRKRRQEGFFLAGSASQLGMQSKINQFVAGVTASRVFDNDTDLIDSFGRPPHSIHVVVEGGSDADLAQAIFEYKSAGIATFGSVSQQVLDSQGQPVTINFDRFVDLYAWIQVTITEKNFEEVYPADGEQQIKENLLSFSESEFSFGDDLIYQKFFGPVYDVPGIRAASIAIATTASPVGTPVFVSDNIVIDPINIARFDLSRITVIDNS
jgi:uncharacterized phage protein gp47/JayE